METIKKTLTAFFRAWPLLVLYGLWTAVFLPLGYLTLSIPEASAITVVASALLAIVCLGSFCSLQGATIFWLNRAVDGPVRWNLDLVKGLFGSAFIDGAKIALLSTLIALPFWGATVLLPAVPTSTASELNQPLTGEVPNATPTTQPEARVAKGVAQLATRSFWVDLIRSALLWLALPLLAMRLWSEATVRGLGSAFKALTGRAWSAWSPLALLCGLIALTLVLGVPVLLLSVGTKVENTYMALGLFGFRMAMAWLLPVTGWLLAMAFSVASVRQE